jgi:hypothetical protein
MASKPASKQGSPGSQQASQPIPASPASSQPANKPASLSKAVIPIGFLSFPFSNPCLLYMQWFYWHLAVFFW